MLRRLLRDLSGIQKTCKGCKTGYLDGSRDLSRARCKMKKCCLTGGHITCGDCEEYDRCEIIQSFLNHPGYKYGKYKQALEYIRAHGHARLPECGGALDRCLWQVP